MGFNYENYMCLLIWTVFSGEWCGPWASCFIKVLLDVFFCKLIAWKHHHWFPGVCDELFILILFPFWSLCPRFTLTICGFSCTPLLLELYIFEPFIFIPALSKESSGILLLPLSVRPSVRPSERKVCHWNSVYILRIWEMIL